MGQKDISEKLLEDYNDVFADIVDVLLFDGDEVIKEEDLSPSTIRSQYKADDRKLHEQERDIAKIWKEKGICIALIGIENQTGEDKDMPLRVIGYEGVSHRSQVLGNNTIRYPVITLILYFGDKPWSGPRSLSECFQVPDTLIDFFNDYRMHVVDVPFLAESQIAKFKSDFAVIADYFHQVAETGRYVPNPRQINHVDAVLKFLNAFTKDDRFAEVADEARNEGKEVKTMCDVLDRVENRGLEKGGNLMIYSLVADGDLSPEKGAKRLFISVDSLKKNMEQEGYKFPK